MWKIEGRLRAKDITSGAVEIKLLLDAQFVHYYLFHISK